jgi:hypothetical protein
MVNWYLLKMVKIQNYNSEWANNQYQVSTVKN